MGKKDKANEEALQRELEEARQARSANRELRERLRDDPGLQERVRRDMVADLLRVKDHPENNSIVSPVSRQCYRDKLGHYPEILVSDFFGNHSEFLRAAGLSDSRNTAVCRNKAAKLSTEQGVHRYAVENVLRYHGKYVRSAPKSHIEGIVASDLHSLHCDPFALDCLLLSIKMVQPDVVVINGDAADFPQISSHPKLPGHFHLNLQQEIDWVRDLFRHIRAIAPDSCTLYYVIGNHEYRLVRYLADTAPALASLRSLRFGQLFGLDEFEVALICRSNFLAPSSKARRADLAENWVVIGDCYAITHGTSCTKFAAEKELQRFMMSGTSGHTHRPQVYYHNTLGTGGLSWMSTPMMCHHSDGRDFVHGPSAWNMGFGQFSILPGRGRGVVSQQIVQVHEDVCFFAGAVFEPTKAVLAAREAMMGVQGAA